MTYVEIEVPYTDTDGETDFLYPDFCAKVVTENNGVGSYEYAGIRGHDKGQDYITIEDDISWDRENFTDTQNATISAWFQNNQPRVEDELFEKYKSDMKD